MNKSHFCENSVKATFAKSGVKSVFKDFFGNNLKKMSSFIIKMIAKSSN
jgi:hypothetical protein